MGVFKSFGYQKEVKIRILKKVLIVYAITIAFNIVCSIWTQSNNVVAMMLGIMLQLLAEMVGAVYIYKLTLNGIIQTIKPKYQTRYLRILRVIPDLLIFYAALFLGGYLYLILAIIFMLVSPAFGVLLLFIGLIVFFVLLYVVAVIALGASTEYFMDNKNEWFGVTSRFFNNGKEYFKMFKFDVLQAWVVIVPVLIVQVIGLVVLMVGGAYLGLVLSTILTIAISVTFGMLIRWISITLLEVAVRKLDAKSYLVSEHL